ncbi:uncharacterized protein FIBRA_02830 [Fibroporia radiculosa]|uniref:Uncharacterized protein n=1 Tax=Fibroporia radiculosa TaxID=599839 RepID=J4G2Y0_9APHY|nr:uncharacterized protein FIBRA_02830 [Fibroporia radiculosa]CCM00788.1 predicted protein [Fibroporia radiculosa]
MGLSPHALNILLIVLGLFNVLAWGTILVIYLQSRLRQPSLDSEGSVLDFEKSHLPRKLELSSTSPRRGNSPPSGWKPLLLPAIAHIRSPRAKAARIGKFMADIQPAVLKGDLLSKREIEISYDEKIAFFRQRNKPFLGFDHVVAL